MSTEGLRDISTPLVMPGYSEASKGQMSLTDYIFLSVENQRDSLVHPLYCFPYKAVPKNIPQDCELRAS